MSPIPPVSSPKDNSRKFITNSLYLATFLSLRGFPLLKTINTGTNYKNLVFEDSDRLKEAIRAFNENETVPVLSFINCYQSLKSIIFRNETDK